MGLTCAYSLDPSGYDYYVVPRDMQVVPCDVWCRSCGRIITKGEEVRPVSDVEISDDGEFTRELERMRYFYCEHCAEILDTLEELGYHTYGSGESAADLLKDYWEETGFDPDKYNQGDRNAPQEIS